MRPGRQVQRAKICPCELGLRLTGHTNVVLGCLAAYGASRRSAWLGVMYQHVVPIQTGTGDGWSTAEASMRTVPVVVMEPARKMRGAFL